MKLIRNIETKVVHYLLTDGQIANITPIGLEGEFRANYILPDTHEIVEGIADKPPLWASESLTYEDGVWGVATTDATFIKDYEEAKAQAVRADRDSRLAVTDFHGLTDNTMCAEMTTYRQSLRDVPQQGGFPTEIDWPTEPS